MRSAPPEILGKGLPQALPTNFEGRERNHCGSFVVLERERKKIALGIKFGERSACGGSVSNRGPGEPAPSSVNILITRFLAKPLLATFMFPHSAAFCFLNWVTRTTLLRSYSCCTDRSKYSPWERISVSMTEVSGRKRIHVQKSTEISFTAMLARKTAGSCQKRRTATLGGLTVQCGARRGREDLASGRASAPGGGEGPGSKRAPSPSSCATRVTAGGRDFDTVSGSP